MAAVELAIASVTELRNGWFGDQGTALVRWRVTHGAVAPETRDETRQVAVALW